MRETCVFYHSHTLYEGKGVISMSTTYIQNIGKEGDTLQSKKRKVVMMATIAVVGLVSRDRSGNRSLHLFCHTPIDLQRILVEVRIKRNKTEDACIIRVQQYGQPQVDGKNYMCSGL